MSGTEQLILILKALSCNIQSQNIGFTQFELLITNETANFIVTDRGLPSRYVAFCADFVIARQLDRRF
jgi:hypothetical protein